MGLASRMQLFKPDTVEEVLRSGYCVDRFDKPTINHLTKMMLSKDRLNGYLVSKKIQE